MLVLSRFACKLEEHEMEAGEEAGLLDEEQSLLVTSRLHQVLRPLMLRRLKQTVASELPSKVSWKSPPSFHHHLHADFCTQQAEAFDLLRRLSTSSIASRRPTRLLSPQSFRKR